MSVNQKDIARLLGVSRATVSRSLSGHPYVDEGLRAKVLETADRLGYHPNFSATSLHSKRTDTISVVRYGGWQVPEVHSTWIAAIQMHAQERGLRFRLDRGEDIQRISLESSSDGFIVFGSPDEVGHEGLSMLAVDDLPVVFTDCREGALAANCVTVDGAGGSGLAVDHLVSLGHRKIGFVGLNHFGVARDRHRGYVRGLNDCGLAAPSSFTLSFVSWAPSPNCVLEYAGEVLRLVELGCTGLIACSDLTAVGVMKVLSRNGVRVPEDVSVIGFDDSVLTSSWEPALTVVVQDLDSAAREAVTMLGALISSGEPQKPVVVAASLLVRESTKACKE